MAIIYLADILNAWSTFGDQVDTEITDMERKVAVAAKRIDPAAKNSGKILEGGEKELAIFRKYIAKMDPKILKTDKTGYLEGLMEDAGNLTGDKLKAYAEKKLAAEERRIRILASKAEDDADWSKGLAACTKGFATIRKVVGKLGDQDKPAATLVKTLGSVREAFTGASDNPKMTEEKFAAVKAKLEGAADALAKKMVWFKEAAKLLKPVEDEIRPYLEGMASAGVKLPQETYAKQVDALGMDIMRAVKLESDRISALYRSELEKIRTRWSEGKTPGKGGGPREGGPVIGASRRG
jgi:hypothetical protein